MQESGKEYPFEARTLEGKVSDCGVHFEIEIIVDDFPYVGELSDVIPWHGHVGGGKQMDFKLPIDPDTGHAATWTSLEEKGLIKITIKILK